MCKITHRDIYRENKALEEKKNQAFEVRMMKTVARYKQLEHI